MRILFALPGFHRYERGAEIALIALAKELSLTGDMVTLIGSGEPRPDVPYRFIKAASIRREKFEHFPKIPVLRGETSYEEATFMPGLWRKYNPTEYDVTVTCSYPFTNWLLRSKSAKGLRPAHVFVTQNGDWPAQSQDAEYARFGCEGLACTNPDYFAKNHKLWYSALIPNGIDVEQFFPGPGNREKFGLPADRKVILMVSALIPSKRVTEGIAAVARIENAHLVVAGDGPLRGTVDQLAAKLLPGRFSRVSVKSYEMPILYRSADAFLHLSMEESFGNVFVEALACGLPIVANDSQRVRWIVGDLEFLTDTSDSDSIATALNAAMQSSEESREVRVDRAATFAWSSVARQYRTFFQEVLANLAKSQESMVRG
ncbi:hypothetical protein BH09PSE3_BH09PSE3_00160 [soil metagenome]